MDFFKVKRFRKVHKPDPEKETDDKPHPSPEEMKIGNGNGNDDSNKSSKIDDPAATNEVDDDEDDDDFITNEVKRRLKELRRNSFMVLIPEETCQEGEEEEDEEEVEVETSSGDWRSSEVEYYPPSYSFDELYESYCERMLFFDRLSAQQLKEAGSLLALSPSPKSASKKLVSTLRSLSFKKREESQDDEPLQQPQDDPYQDLEVAYVAHICLTWEALQCQYLQLNQKLSSDPESSTSYSHVAQQFQQFQVLLQRFIENEPFEQTSRPETYARTRNSFAKLLQVPSIKDFGKKNIEDEEEYGSHIFASNLLKIMESSILTLRVFLKMDKKKAGIVLNLFGGHNQIASPLQQIQSSLDKKELKLKEFVKKKKSWKKKSWPGTVEEVELLFGLTDIKLVSRVLRMGKISKEQLLWCEEKLSKLGFLESKFRRDGTPILFPCQ
ncbi:hypothetical protein ACHQM5_030375 [Ranunculus cassubicifolius]